MKAKIAASGSSKKELLYFGKDSVKRVRFLQELDTGFTFQFHNDWNAGILELCKDPEDHENCKLCEQGIKVYENFAWSVWDYDSNAVRILLFKASGISPIPAFIEMYEEFGTIMEYHIPVKMILLNNNYLGNVRQWQDMFFGHRQSFTPMTNPDFSKIADAYGIPYRRVIDRAELNDAINEMLTTDGPFLLETVIKPNANVEPMTAPGKAIDEMILNIEC